MSDAITAAANDLFEARRSRKPIKPIRDTYGIATATEAYAIQERNSQRLIGEGHRPTGCKIGLTAESVQKQMGVNEPDYGLLWETHSFESGDSVAANIFIQPRIEAEIAFVMARDMTHEKPTLVDTMNAVAYALAAVEIVDSAIENWNIKLVDTIADNASAGGYFLSTERRALDGLDLRLCGMTISKRGRPVSLGVGAACLGHPLRALRWLSEKMNAVGRPLRAGDLVLSGALGPMVPAARGDEFAVEIQGFSPLTVSFD